METGLLPARPASFYQDIYRQLRRDAQQAGVFEPTPWLYPLWLTGVLALYGAGFAQLLLGGPLVLRLLASGLVAFCTVQLGLIGHEAGHSAITRSPIRRWLIGQLADTLLAGVSFRYWNSTHVPHHGATQRWGDDPDMRFATISVDERSARQRTGLGRWITRHQMSILPLAISIWGFSLRIDGWIYVIRSGRRALLDLGVLVLHLLLWIVLPAALLGWPAALVNYALVTILTGPYLGGLFVVNHVGMPVLSPEERPPFLLHQILTSRNFGQGWFRDVFCAGLNLQIEHHLFPTVPYLRLRRARPLVQRLCERHGIPYKETTFVGAYREVVQHMARVARAADQR